jgi:hypothetical protein
VTKVLATEPPPYLLEEDNARVRRSLVVGVLCVIPSTIIVDDPTESILVRGSCREAAHPRSLRRVDLVHVAIMNGSLRAGGGRRGCGGAGLFNWLWVRLAGMMVR